MSKEYIEKDRALAQTMGYASPSIKAIHKRIESIEPADVKPAAHASWVQDDENIGGDIWRKWRCDECGYVRKKGWAYEPEGRKPTARFCENCGADMKGGPEE